MAFKKIKNFASDVGKGFQDWKKAEQAIDKKAEKMAGSSGASSIDATQQAKIARELRQKNNPSLVDSIQKRRNKRRNVGK